MPCLLIGTNHHISLGICLWVYIASQPSLTTVRTSILNQSYWPQLLKNCIVSNKLWQDILTLTGILKMLRHKCSAARSTWITNFVSVYLFCLPHSQPTNSSWSSQLFNWTRHFLILRMPTTGPRPEPSHSSLHLHNPFFFKICFNVNLPSVPLKFSPPLRFQQ